MPVRLLAVYDPGQQEPWLLAATLESADAAEWLYRLRARPAARAPDLRWLVRRALRWLALYLWPTLPLWRPWQDRYRRLHWWPDAA